MMNRIKVSTTYTALEKLQNAIPGKKAPVQQQAQHWALGELSVEDTNHIKTAIWFVLSNSQEKLEEKPVMPKLLNSTIQRLGELDSKWKDFD